MTTAQAIRTRISRLPKGEPFTLAPFIGLGTRGAIDMSLKRLVEEGRVARIGRGLYVVPKAPVLGVKVFPGAAAVAHAVAKASGATIAEQGAEAAWRLGFTTQIPVKPIYNTSGPTRRIRFANTVIQLKHVAQRKMVLAGRPAGTALSALWYMGKKEVTIRTIRQLAQRLSVEEFDALLNARRYMPFWMAQVFQQYSENGQP